ncbi:type VI secretion system tube protein Hcp [Paenibacillus sp. PR3]|uniref:Type VI secretion system tube protein Hcp n=1 Tax=Paenibacillus terricola TaxID=2763503 RepID=A0ABR8MWM4_9BACL|nr:type VI secretion system tube protein Hcp [Paenibacillus terricola]MBD3920367.1 type VI secretion system tube protein Hcp [Paenibacillus terricola]
MRRFVVSVFAACLLALTFSVIPAAAADLNGHLFLRLDGIAGEAKSKPYDKWIDLTSIAYEISGNQTTFDPSHAAGKIGFDSFVISKGFDSSSIPIMLSGLQGTHIPKGKLVFTRPYKGQDYAYLTLEFDSITVSSYSFEDTEESIALLFKKIKWTYIPFDSKGAPATPIQGGWDLTKGTETETAADAVAPVTKSTFTPVVAPPKNNVTALKVTITATDDNSGVNRTEYRINGGEWVIYTAAFTVQAATCHTLEWRSIDNAGNVEKTWFADFDKGTPPKQI